METIGRYQILSELGRGGCGVVYRALDPSIGRTVAIKTIRVDNDNGDLRERFRREARSAGILSHPNIVTIHEFNDTGDPMFIAMEYIDGQTLAQRMKDGLMPVEFTLSTIRAAADALDFAHAHNIVHRDVKPANFLITKQGHLRMADFGIAKMLDGDVGLTNTGMVVGTAQYMSPEQIAAKDVTGRSDQFSLAVIAYEMLTGQRPFQGNSWASMMHAIMVSEPPALKEHQQNLGDEASDVLRKGLAKDPQERFPTCMAFAEALERSILGPTLERTAYREPPKPTVKTAETMEMPRPTLLKDTETRALVGAAPTLAGAPTGPTTTKEIVPPAGPRRSWILPIAAGVVIVIGLGTWVGLRSRGSGETAHPAAPPNTTSPSTAAAPAPASQSTASSIPAEPRAEPRAEPPAEPATKAKGSSTRSVKENPKPAAAAKAPAVTKPGSTEIASAPAAAAVNPPPPVSQPVVVNPQPAPAPPATSTPPPAAAPSAAALASKRAEDERIAKAAEEAKRAADERAKRLADEQAKNALAEKARLSHVADLQAVSRALADYQAAYQRKDVEALQAIWPTIAKPVLEGIRGSFHDASEVSMELHALGDPVISGSTATVTGDRKMHQVIRKKTFQASDRVRIVLNRAGAGWVIQSIEAVGK